MNIIEFKDRVYQRIISQYLKDVRKEKLTEQDYKKLLWSSAPILCFALGCFFYEQGKSYWYEILIVFIVIASFVTMGIGAPFYISQVFELINFKKSSDKYWGTTFLPLPQLSDCELSFLIENNRHSPKLYNSLYCNFFYSQEQIDNLMMFTDDEQEIMKSFTFNETQKEFILECVKNNIVINFYTLAHLIYKSDQGIQEQKALKKEQEQKTININKFILDNINHKPTQELEMGESIPLKQKFKQLL